MAVEGNPTLGYTKCGGCGARIEVAQTKRGKGRYLYTRCTECGTDQRTGKAVQTHLWMNTEWLDGPPEEMPPNVVLEDYKPQSDDPEPVKTPAAAEKKSEKKGGGGVVAVALAGVAALIGGIFILTGGKSD